MAFVEDISSFFSTDDFAEEITLDGATINAIFDNPTESVDLYDTAIEATDASILIKTEDAQSIARNQTVVINSVSYKVARWTRIDDGVLTRIFLNRL